MSLTVYIATRFLNNSKPSIFKMYPNGVKKFLTESSDFDLYSNSSYDKLGTKGRYP